MRRTRLPIKKARFRPNPQNSIVGDEFGCMGIRTDNPMVKPCPNQSGRTSHLHCNPRIAVDTFHYGVNLYLPQSCSVQEWGDLKNVGLNNPTARDVECGATLILNMNRMGSSSIPLLSFDFDSIPVGKEATFRIQLGLGYLLHASSSHQTCKGQGPLTPGSFFRGGGQFRSLFDGLTT